MYKKILAALDGSHCSNLAVEAVRKLALQNPSCEVLGCHVYAAALHRERFAQMEPGLPERYQEEERLEYLRNTHEDLITDGMQLISDAYLAPLVRAAQESGFTCIGATPEGANSLKLLNLIAEYQPDLVVIGAWGHGRVPESALGGLSERVLMHAHQSDVLIMRTPLDFKGHPIVVGVDGSQNAAAALQTAVSLANSSSSQMHGVAVYDPYFHLGVFKTIADSLPEQDRQRFDFPAQEKLHDEIIDRGLEKIYAEGLDQAAMYAHSCGLEMKTSVLAGKVYPQIHHYASLHNAGLVVTGRWGIHQQPGSLLGSNTHNLARLLTTNLLVCRPPDQPVILPERAEPAEVQDIPWTPEAEERLKRVPVFVRRMARKAIQDRARELKLKEITADFVQQMASRMGRG